MSVIERDPPVEHVADPGGRHDRAGARRLLVGGGPRGRAGVTVGRQPPGRRPRRSTARRRLGRGVRERRFRHHLRTRGERARPAGRRPSATGCEAHFSVIGADPLTDLAVIRIDESGLPTARARRRRATPGRAAARRHRQPARLRRIDLCRRRQRPRPVDRHQRRPPPAHRRERHPDRRLAPSRATRAARSPTGMATSWASTPPWSGLGSARASGSPCRSTPSVARSSARSSTTAACAGPGSVSAAARAPCHPRSPKRWDGPTVMAVTSVVDGSPASDGAILPGDVIVSLDEVPIEGVPDLQRLMTGHRVDRQVDVTVIRDGAERALRVTLSELAN